MDDEQRRHLERLRDIKQRRLRELEKQAATLGPRTAPEVNIELADLQSELEQIDLQIETAEGSSKGLKQTKQRQISSKKSLESLKPSTTVPVIRQSFQQTEISPRLRVFLCHSSKDKPAIRALYERLLLEGVDPWLDEEKLLPGQKWRQEIPKAIKQADAVIVCLSRNSETRAGYLQKEIRYALDIAEQKPKDTIYIIPLRLEECKVPERLRDWHWSNLYEEDGYTRLSRALRARATGLYREISSLPIIGSQTINLNTKPIAKRYISRGQFIVIETTFPLLMDEENKKEK